MGESQKKTDYPTATLPFLTLETCNPLHMEHSAWKGFQENQTCFKKGGTQIRTGDGILRIQ